MFRWLTGYSRVTDPNPRTPSLFSRLPSEIRDEIFFYALYLPRKERKDRRDSITVSYHPAKVFVERDSLCKRNILHILLVSRQFNIDARYTLFTHAVFRLNDPVSRYELAPGCWGTSSLVKLSMTVGPWIRKFHCQIYADIYWPQEDEVLFEDLRASVAMISKSFPNLRELYLSLDVCYLGVGFGDCEEALDLVGSALQPLLSLETLRVEYMAVTDSCGPAGETEPLVLMDLQKRFWNQFPSIQRW